MIQLLNTAHDFDIPVGAIGTTVRLGDKWVPAAQRRETVALWVVPAGYTPDSKGPLYEDGCQMRGTARIIGYWTGYLGEAPEDLLILNDELLPVVQDRHELILSLERGYPDQDFHTLTLVTVLIYQRLTEVDTPYEPYGDEELVEGEEFPNPDVDTAPVEFAAPGTI